MRQATSMGWKLRRGGVCPGQSGTAARRANFGPDYQSPSLASLLSRRTRAPGHTACRPSACGHYPRDTSGNKRPGKGNPWPHLSRKSFGTPRRTAISVPIASHLASPLRPGRGVLIRSVSRRLGSVAYVREDASPNEVSRFQPHTACPEAKLNVNSGLTVVSVCRCSRCPPRGHLHGATSTGPPPRGHLHGATFTGLPGCRGRAAPGRPGARRAGDPADSAWIRGFPIR